MNMYDQRDDDRNRRSGNTRESNSEWRNNYSDNYQGNRGSGGSLGAGYRPRSSRYDDYDNERRYQNSYGSPSRGGRSNDYEGYDSQDYPVRNNQYQGNDYGDSRDNYERSRYSSDDDRRDRNTRNHQNYGGRDNYENNSNDFGRDSNDRRQNYGNRESNRGYRYDDQQYQYGDSDRYQNQLNRGGGRESNRGNWKYDQQNRNGDSSRYGNQSNRGGSNYNDQQSYQNRGRGNSGSRNYDSGYGESREGFRSNDDQNNFPYPPRFRQQSQEGFADRNPSSYQSNRNSRDRYQEGSPESYRAEYEKWGERRSDRRMNADLGYWVR